MNIDWSKVLSDPAWWSALSALFALIVAIVSFFAASKAASAASRSAEADELSSRLAKGLARTCHARWEIKIHGQMYDPNADFKQDEHGTGTVKNVGDEVAFDVHATGDIHKRNPVPKVQPGQEFTFQYDISPEDGKNVYIEWSRPEEFEDGRLQIRHGFF
ncbi:hypothetical protein [Nocardiopsis aegyptia]|uniref:Uncharacterized protein n=1 Tax=Nocardiopsis aegyptia TaxID=220378 RepID=A0A7Z0J9G0_9ACTN|nr:hypothetical protein [Nocardiopsis aegyptia]NYJ33454.1 hypothetical protein [Nocardiopsis aegyptia]